jgi:hypothetical protein
MLGHLASENTGSFLRSAKAMGQKSLIYGYAIITLEIYITLKST